MVMASGCGHRPGARLWSESGSARDRTCGEARATFGGVVYVGHNVHLYGLSMCVGLLTMSSMWSVFHSQDAGSEDK